jgi:hypothetical protein
MSLPALIAALALLLHRGPVPTQVSRAIAHACTEEASRYPVDAEQCAALVTVYASRESNYRPGIYGDSGRSYGLLQLPSVWATELDTVGQVRAWLAMLRRGSLSGLDSSPRRAARRLALASALLEQVRGR